MDLVIMPALPQITIGSTFILRPRHFEIEYQQSVSLHLPTRGQATNVPYSPALFVTAPITAYHAGEICHYHIVRPQILDILQRAFPESESSWGLTLIARVLSRVTWASSDQVVNDNYFTPTIYIVCSNPNLIINAIEGALQSCPLRCEIQKGSLDLLNEHGCRGYEREVSMGRSIGVQGDGSSGTMGGWIFDVNTSEMYGLTAGHVCLANQSRQLDGLPHSVAMAGTVIVQPSDEDYAAVSLELTKEAAKAHQQSEQMGFMHPLFESRRLVAEEEVQAFQAVCADRVFGKVIGSHVAIINSPRTTAPQWKDYGLICPVPSMFVLKMFRPYR